MAQVTVLQPMPLIDSLPQDEAATQLSHVEDSSIRKPPLAETYPRPKGTGDRPFHAEASAQKLEGLFPPSHAVMKIPSPERLLNAREVAARLGVSERWVRDHTTRRSPKIRGVKLGTLMRYKRSDVEEFMEKLTTSRSSLQPRFDG